MADKNSRVQENVQGSFYVDTNCIACGVCTDEAPECFKFTDSGDYAYVCKQPETAAEKEQCESALSGCPAEAIGDDG
jgi:ferredoxin